MDKTDRVATAISGFDEIISGGFIPRSSILVSGSPGAGKTNFGLNFLYNGAAKFGEKGLFISLEHTTERSIRNAKMVFPMMDWDKAVERGDIIFEKVENSDFAEIAEMIRSKVKNNGVKRVVLDSITIAHLYSKDEVVYRTSLLQLLEVINMLDCTTIITAERNYADRDKSEFKVEEFVTDMVIALYSIPKGEIRYKALEVLKMRGSEFKMKLCPFKITPTGLVVYPIESVFWLEAEKKRAR